MLGPPQYFANGKSYDLQIWHARAGAYCGGHLAAQLVTGAVANVFHPLVPDVRKFAAKWREKCQTRRALGGAHVPPTKVFPRLAVNKTILKPRLAAATGAQYLYVGFSRRNKIPRWSTYDIGESNPVPASRL